MTFLPIKFQTKFKVAEYKDLNRDEILRLTKDYLYNDGFEWVKQKKDTLVFYRLGGFTSFFNNFSMGSGEVRVLEDSEYITVVNGNWTVFLIAIPFIVLLIIGYLPISTFDADDTDLIWTAFLFLFGGNVLIRTRGHYSFKEKLKDLINENFMKQPTPYQEKGPKAQSQNQKATEK